MKSAYPIFMTETESNNYLVYVPGFDINTQGHSITDAIEMARDAIGLIGVDMEDDGETIPSPSSLASLEMPDGSMYTFVDVDFTAYRKSLDIPSVKLI